VEVLKREIGVGKLSGAFETIQRTKTNGGKLSAKKRLRRAQWDLLTSSKKSEGRKRERSINISYKGFY